MSKPLRAARALLALTTLLGAHGTARADAASDVRAIRAGTLPTRVEFLGWTGAGEAVFRTLVCGEDASTHCRAAIETIAPGATRPRQSELLDIGDIDCGHGRCEALSPAVVRAFAAAEARAMAALPPRTRTPPLADPGAASGPVTGQAVRLEVRSRPARRDGEDGVRTELALRRADGVEERVAEVSRFDSSVDFARVTHAFASPDGRLVAVAVNYGPNVMCWGPINRVELRVIDVAHARAALANTAGFRAWRAGDLTTARAGFTEASALDPGYALAWYNRGAVESRTGAVREAAVSLGRARALDASMGVRACRDSDYSPLRADPVAGASLACPSPPAHRR